MPSSYDRETILTIIQQYGCLNNSYTSCHPNVDGGNLTGLHSWMKSYEQLRTSKKGRTSLPQG